MVEYELKSNDRGRGQIYLHIRVRKFPYETGLIGRTPGEHAWIQTAATAFQQLV